MYLATFDRRQVGVDFGVRERPVHVEPRKERIYQIKTGNLLILEHTAWCYYLLEGTHTCAGAHHTSVCPCHRPCDCCPVWVFCRHHHPHRGG